MRLPSILDMPWWQPAACRISFRQTTARESIAAWDGGFKLRLLSDVRRVRHLANLPLKALVDSQCLCTCPALLLLPIRRLWTAFGRCLW